MNRQQRRKLERKGTVTSSRDGFRPIQMKRGPTIEEFDANTMFRLKFDIKAPGGPLRSDHPSQLAGVIEARNESDLSPMSDARKRSVFALSVLLVLTITCPPPV